MNKKPSVQGCMTRLQEMVRINTCQPLGNELDLVKYIEQLFPADSGVTMQRFNHSENRSSLIVKLPGESDMGGLAFAGHLDTVACGDESKWIQPPHACNYVDGKLYGRGSSDMKGGDAAFIEMALCLLENKVALKKPIYLCFTADEETKGTGIVAMAQSGVLKDVDAVFIAEPSNEEIGLAEKGALWLRLHAKGVQAHGSRPEIGVNAVEQSMLFVNRLREVVDISERNPLLDTTTLSVTRFNGGIMTNVIPEEATMDIDMRTLPTIDHSRVLADAEAICRDLEKNRPGLHLELEILNNRPAVETPESDAFIQQLESVHRELGMPIHCKGLYFYTDASQIIPAIRKPFVILGPGDDKLAHQTNEYNTPESVQRMANLYLSYVMKYLAK